MKLQIAVMTALCVVAPAMAADPSAAPNPPGHDNKPDHAGPKDKSKEPKAPITLHGTITQATNDKGKAVFQLTSGGTTYTLSVGPSWFAAADDALESRVGDSVTVVGEVAAGSTEVDVLTVDGEQVREGGKPPWAGARQPAGGQHFGWSEEKAALMAEKFAMRQLRFGGCFPPGHCKPEGEAGG